LSSDGKTAAVLLQGRIFASPESAKRRWLIDNFPLHIQPAPDRSDRLFRERAGLFWSDSERLEPVSIRIGARVVVLPASDAGGHFKLELPLAHEEASQLESRGKLMLQTVATPRTPQVSQAPAWLVPDVGLTVITDVDDTIKDTRVLDKPRRDANTFFNRFQPVEGMPELYRAWQQALGARIHFHAVSAGPWQLHGPIRAFTEEAGFPPFTWDMRSMKISDLDGAREVLDDEWAAQRREDYKVGTIQAFMMRFPRRHVVLVGDSGERDPEVYDRIISDARFGNRIDWVLIRDVTMDPKLEKRPRPLFVTPENASRLRVFTDPLRDLSSLPLVAPRP
jgi:phosphatidate phosphatase APP1